MTASLAPEGLTTPLGRVGAGTKMVLVLLLSVALVLSVDWVTAILGLACLLVAMATLGLRPWQAVRTLWPIFLAALLSGWATLLMATPSGPVVVDLGFRHLTSGALAAGAAIFLRGCALALVSVMFVRTTDPSEMGESLAQTFRLPARFVLSAVAAFRLVGIMTEEWQVLAAARRARGLAGERGVLGRLRGFGQQSFSLMVQALRRASRLAVTMEARGFGAGERTWARRPRFGRADALALLLGLGIVLLAVGGSMLMGTYASVFSVGVLG